MKTIAKLATLVAFFFSAISIAAPVNINTANASEISQALTGIGISKAEAIVNYRTNNGLFSNAEQILQVKGIGHSTFEKNKADIFVK